jgi:hypothetical protein
VLLGCYRKGEAADPEIYVPAVIAVLNDYPDAVIRAVCDPRKGMPSRLKWLPTIAEVKAACEEQMEPVYRRQHQARLDAERRTMLAAPPAERMSAEDMRARYGDDYGLHPERAAGRARWTPPRLADMCATAGVDMAEIDRLSEAERATRRKWGQTG